MSKSMIILIIVSTFFGALFWYFGGQDIQNEIPYYLKKATAKTTTIAVREVIIDAEVVETPSAQQRGLSGREGLSGNRGMLFPFAEAGEHSITMRGMLFSIDILWIHEGKIVHMVDDALQPKDSAEPAVYTPPVPSTYVLEANNYFIQESGAAVGDFVALGLTQE
ncbi:MAG: hypothetical protein A2898_00285 [Candidatus Kerfeldbacteria bacterium RIFCSPLOWO2_01_FULL_48_11]|uniref:DUF192 domain-containing protein n=1 Tax=Candidatus Kerfeldbacteria bacterium RIFCSPLOWO2_01_FULL_48_11 TaxID=1798543 RepID=A0A1G2B5H5_9BACT|nr:MAG: hypothetical protein A2898_00285 [Candidatus Kerfeldbacteria bacterium RIFCSPLOWO2_01_FULL_48_11]HCJ52211.1 hypothetical protein [Candidatus Kerfeldbacteria bacterium]